MFKEVENRANLLGEGLSRRGIVVVLFDLDDTLLDTNKVFRDQRDKFVDALDRKFSNLTKEDIGRSLTNANNAAYYTHSVSPTRWDEVAKSMSEELALPFEGISAELPILRQIYKTAPELHEGALETLQVFLATGVQMGLVTHASQEWTQIKLEAHNLFPFFDEIVVVDENIFKGPEHWLEAINRFNVLPEQVMSMGDNLGGDIRATAELGVKHRIYLPGKWSIYSDGEIPEGTIVVEEGIKKVVDSLL